MPPEALHLVERIKVRFPRWGYGRDDRDWEERRFSHYFMLLNANKRSVTLNLKTSARPRNFAELMKKADVSSKISAPA